MPWLCTGPGLLALAKSYRCERGVPVALPDFQYFCPSTLDEAMALLASHEGAKLLAGGQSLIPLLSMRLAQPSAVIDISRLSELRYIREVTREEDGHLVIGALTTHREVETSPLVRRRCPVLAEAGGLIGHSHIRLRGTLGGSLAHADPAAELPVTCVLTGATLVLVGPGGQRRVAADNFFLAPFMADLAPGELITAVEVPFIAPGTGAAFRELTLRRGDFALVAAGALVEPGPGGTVAAVRIAVGGATPVPVRTYAAEAAGRGRPAGPDLWRELGRLAAEELAPDSDIHATAEYRREMAAVYVRDALATAYARAGGYDDH